MWTFSAVCCKINVYLSVKKSLFPFYVCVVHWWYQYRSVVSGSSVSTAERPLKTKSWRECLTCLQCVQTWCLTILYGSWKVNSLQQDRVDIALKTFISAFSSYCCRLDGCFFLLSAVKHWKASLGHGNGSPGPASCRAQRACFGNRSSVSCHGHTGISSFHCCFDTGEALTNHVDVVMFCIS